MTKPREKDEHGSLSRIPVTCSAHSDARIWIEFTMSDNKESCLKVSVFRKTKEWLYDFLPSSATGWSMGLPAGSFRFSSESTENNM
jgi:hypothetical protein